MTKPKNTCECGNSIPDRHNSTIKAKKCPNCLLKELSKKKRTSAPKKETKAKKQAKKTTKKKRTDWREKPLNDLIQHVQEIFCNPYIRERDKALFGTCISCNSGITQAGHFYAVGSSSGMRFLVNNIHGQEISCNHFKGSNALEYEKGLINRHGQTYLDKLKFDKARYQQSHFKFHKFDVIQIGETYDYLLKNKIWVFEQPQFNKWRDKICNEKRT